MIDCIALLSQAVPLPPQSKSANGMPLLIGMVLFVGVFFYMTSRSQKRERNKKAELLDNLKKNDRVLTIGGVIGTVVNVSDNKIVLKVDEATNTRMTFIKRSIQQVVTEDTDLKLE
mgnify:CR=1 FL=1